MYSDYPVNYCDTHRKVETMLSCGRCEKFICPRCMVQTPVGIRCRDCGQARPLPQYTVAPPRYVFAMLAALALAIACGVVWAAVMDAAGGFFFVPWLCSGGAGYVIGEGVSMASGRRKTWLLSMFAVWAAAIAYGIMLGSLLAQPGGLSIDLFSIAFLVMYGIVAILIANSRIR